MGTGAVRHKTNTFVDIFWDRDHEALALSGGVRRDIDYRRIKYWALNFEISDIVY